MNQDLVSQLVDMTFHPVNFCWMVMGVLDYGQRCIDYGMGKGTGGVFFQDNSRVFYIKWFSELIDGFFSIVVIWSAEKMKKPEGGFENALIPCPALLGQNGSHHSILSSPSGMKWFGHGAKILLKP